MANLALSRDMLADYAKLQRPAQAKVRQLTDQFQQLTAAQLRGSAGIHLERYEGQLDARARTIRIDSNHRGIVLDTGDDATFVLVRVGTHDDVDRWMTHHKFRVNEATGALEVVNTAAIDAAVAETVGAAVAAESASLLFAHRKDKEFRQLGVNGDLVPALRALTTEEQLVGLLGVLPQGQAEAIILLTGDESVDQIFTTIAGSRTPAEVDTEDLAAAVVSPASTGLFHVVTDEQELQEMLAQPWAQWRTYLHTSQHAAAYRPVYNGPVRITGGAGTGKTVVALHRARFLADRLVEPIGKPILFTTFTRNLAEAIERELRSLGGAEVLDRVEVINVDSLANRIVQSVEGQAPRVLDGADVMAVWTEVADELGSAYDPPFLNAEYEQVVLAQRCRSRSDYFTTPRTGRGVRLSRRERAEVWKAIEALTQRLGREGRRTQLQLADDAAGYLAGRTVKPYQHVVVDEAQDLHETQWHLLRAAVPEAPNDLFIVGDSHQRIYDRRTSLSKVGINIVGRSRRLRINYRTTHEILRWAMAFLGHAATDDLDQGSETQTLAEYHSYMHGPPPTVQGFGSQKAELTALAEQVKSWVDGGVPAEEIAVCARTADRLDAVGSPLRQVGLQSLKLGRTLAVGDGIRLSTMHRLKGLEFRCIAIMGLDDDHMPLAGAVTSATIDATQHEADLRRERSLAYVAATRARDDLWVSWSGRRSRFLPARS